VISDQKGGLKSRDHVAQIDGEKKGVVRRERRKNFNHSTGAKLGLNRARFISKTLIGIGQKKREKREGEGPVTRRGRNWGCLSGLSVVQFSCYNKSENERGGGNNSRIIELIRKAERLGRTSVIHPTITQKQR